MNDYTQHTAPPPPPQGTPDAEQRQWAMFAHLSAILGGLLTAQAGGLGCMAGPFILWQVKKDTMPFVADQAKESLNFNITVALVMLVLLLVGVGTFGLGFIVTAPLMALVGIAALALIIIAAIKANEGVAYRYPLTLRLVK